MEFKCRCLICEKDIETETSVDIRDNSEFFTIYSAGYAYLEFHYGSSLDQCFNYAGRNNTIDEDSKPVDKLLACNKIEAYICDGCLESKIRLMRGYSITNVKKEIVTFDGYEK